MRHERYSSILPRTPRSQGTCTIIGVGAIGRQVALQLAAMGVACIRLVDFDVVEEVNLGTQGYLHEDLGKPKVEATAALMQRLNPQVSVERVNRRFSGHMEASPVVLSCVDSITTRRRIWNTVKDEVELFVDARMAAEVLRILSVSNSVSHERYPGTLFNESEALEQACTARSTIYCANIAAGLMVSQYTRWLRGMATEFDMMLNLLDAELIAG